MKLEPEEAIKGNTTMKITTTIIISTKDREGILKSSQGMIMTGETSKGDLSKEKIDSITMRPTTTMKGIE
jgi:hypothetical protein